MWTTTLWQHGMLPLQWGVVISASLVAAVIDLRERRIPNRLTGPLVLGGFVWAAVVGGPGGVADAAVACVLLAFPFVLLFLFAGGGAGDAKLMGALGAWLGVINGLVALVAVTLAGVLLAVGWAVAKRQVRSVAANVTAVGQAVLFTVLTKGKCQDTKALVPKLQEMQTIPYGVAIFVGVSSAAIGVFLWCA